MDQLNQFTGTVLGCIAAAVALYVWAENRHRRREAERKAEEERRAKRQADILAASRRHIETYVATRKERSDG